MCQLKAYLLVILVSLLCTISGYAQIGNSPYSILGVGDIASPALVHNIGMGGVGLSQPYNLHMNNMNPALLPHNTFTNFGMGVMSDYRRISQNSLSTSSLGGGLTYLTFSFPIITTKWTLSAGLTPYSTVNYNYTTQSGVTGTDTEVNYEYDGEGGINRAYIANGFALSKNLMVGFEASYLFGSIIKETSTHLNGEDISINNFSVIYDRSQFSDFTLKGGLSFHKQVRSRTVFNAGLIYELQSDVNARQFVRLERRIFSNPTQTTTVSMDTVTNNVRGSVRLPSTLGFGVSLLKTYKWTIGSDVVLQNWSVFRNFDGSSSNMNNSYRVSLGGEYTPDASSLDSYLKRMTYRMGFNYEKTPFELNEEQLNDFGINFGMSLPVSRGSSLDLAFKLGQRGTTSNQMIKEDYFKIYLGVTFNDKWFVRRKFD